MWSSVRTSSSVEEQQFRRNSTRQKFKPHRVSILTLLTVTFTTLNTDGIDRDLARSIQTNGIDRDLARSIQTVLIET